jgi:hypothetical protein
MRTKRDKNELGGTPVSIDELPAAEALRRLRIARANAHATLTGAGGTAPFGELLRAMEHEGFGAYDTRLAVASIGARYTADGHVALER